MKMVEKGIDPSTMNRGSGSGSQKMSNAGPRFNAFKELEREAAGKPNALSGAERERKPKVEQPPKPKREDPLEMEFNGKKLTTRPDGTIDPEDVAFPHKSVLKFEGAGENANWKDLKVGAECRVTAQRGAAQAAS
jgi:lupus La protein